MKIKFLKSIAVIFVLTSCSFLFAVSQSHASEYDVGLAKAKHEVACYAYAQGAGLDKETVQDVHLKRLADFSEDMGIVYTLGYVRGSLDVYGYVNASSYDSIADARQAAATHFYGATGCTTGVSS